MVSKTCSIVFFNFLFTLRDSFIYKERSFGFSRESKKIEAKIVVIASQERHRLHQKKGCIAIYRTYNDILNSNCYLDCRHKA